MGLDSCNKAVQKSMFVTGPNPNARPIKTLISRWVKWSILVLKNRFEMGQV